MVRRIEGISVEFDANVTPLQNALRTVDNASRTTANELNQIERGLRFNPESTELLAQRQQVLAEQIGNTSRRLDVLRQAQSQVQQQFERGDIGADQFRAFNRELERTEGQLQSLQTRAQQSTNVNVNADGAVREVGRIEQAFASLPSAATAAASRASSAISGISVSIAGVGAAIGGFATSFTDTNRDLAAIELQLQQVELSINDVSAATTAFTAVGQETDQLAETFGNLVQAGFETSQEINSIAESISGAIAFYGDTFNTEGLAESIALTNQLGEANGQFLDLLERSGVNVDTFNARLSATSDVQERANIVAETLASEGLNDLFEAYATGNPELIAQAEANSQLTQNLSELSAAITPIVTGLTEYLNIILEAINGNISFSDALEQIVSKSSELFPNLLSAGTSAFNGLLEGVQSLIPEFIEFIDNGLPEVIGNIESFLPEFLDKGIDIVTSLLEGLAETFPDVIESIISLLGEMIGSIISKLPDFLNSAVRIISSLIQGISNNVPNVISTIVSLLGRLVSTIISSLPDILAAGGRIVTELIKGIASLAINLARVVITDLFPAFIRGFRDLDFTGIGRDIIQGLINGITNRARELYNTAKKIASNIEETIRRALQTRSPSRVTTAIGQDIVNGLIVGLDGREGALNSKTQELANSISRTLSSGGQINLGDVISLGADRSEQRLFELTNAIRGYEEALSGANIEELSLADDRRRLERDYEELTQRIQEYRENLISEVEGELNDEVIQGIEQFISFSFNQDLSEYQLAQRELADDEQSFGERYARIQQDRFNAQKEYVDGSRRLNRLNIRQELDLYSEFQSNYASDSEQFQYFNQQKINAQQELSRQISDVNNTYTSQIKRANDELLSGVQQLENGYDEAFNGIVNSILGATNVFEEFTRGERVSGQQLISNLESQIRGINEYNSVINTLGARVDDEGFLEYIRSLGPESLAELEAINSLSRTELDRYVDLYNDRFERASNAATIQLQGLREETDNEISLLQQETQVQLDQYEDEWARAISAITTNVNNEFSELPQTLEQVGEDLITNLSNGLSNMLPNLTSQLQDIANTISSTINGALDTNVFNAQIRASSERLANASNSVNASLLNSTQRSQQAQLQQQANANQNNIDTEGLITAINDLANRPINTEVILDRRVLATAVSQTQYDNASINALTRGVVI